MKSLSPWLFLTVPLFFISVGLLVMTVRSLVRTLRGAVVAAVPLDPVQTVDLGDAGPYDLYVEGRPGTMDFAGLDFALTDRSDATVPMERVWFRTRVSGLSRMRLQVRSFTTPSPGQYTLWVSGRGIDRPHDPGDRIVLSRPLRGGMILHILALVLLGASTVGSMVGSALLVVLPGRQ
jgi:hypothetical protein